jgi:ParB family chromosome partitioning protein
MKVNKGLGRGLSALFSDTEEEYEQAAKGGFAEIEKRAMETAKEYNEIELSNIYANPNQPRKIFESTALNELADSIKKHGVIMPIVVNYSDNGYMIIAGERRWRAAKIAGLEKIPAIVKKYTERQIKEVSLIENLQREDLNPIEAASAMKQLMEEYSLTQEELADRIGKSRPLIANTIRLLSLNPEVIKLVAGGKLSAGHARALITLPFNIQLKIANEACDEGSSVRDTELLVKNYINPPEITEQKKEKKRQEISIELKELVERFQRGFKTKVSIMGNDNKGRISIDYFTRDDLDRISEIIELIEKNEKR